MKHVLGWVACGAVLLSASFQAQTGSASTNMEIFRQKIKADKKLIVASTLGLTDADGAKFWPIYDAYQTDLAAINDRTVKLVAQYSTAYNAGPIPAEKAKTLLMETLAIDEAEVKLRRSYVPKLEAALSMDKVARYMQIENKIRAVLKYELAGAIPFVE